MTISTHSIGVSKCHGKPVNVRNDQITGTEWYECIECLDSCQLRHAGGRPTSYEPVFIDSVDEYLKGCVDVYEMIEGIGKVLKVKLPTREKFAQFINVSQDSLVNWGKEYPEFFAALQKIDIEQKQKVLESGLSGAYNSKIGGLILSSNHGMKERSETDLNHKGRVFLGDIVDGLDGNSSKKDESENEHE